MPTLRLADLDLHYEDVGEGPPLVMLHGLGSSDRDWELQVTHFRDRFRVLTPDLRGHGLTAKPPGPYPIPLLAADVARFLAAFGLGPAHVVGVYMGGMICLQLAVDEPEAVRSLVAVNTVPEVSVRTALAAPGNRSPGRDACLGAVPRAAPGTTRSGRPLEAETSGWR